MAIAITAIIGFFTSIICAIAGFVLIWYRSCRMAENENTEKLIRAETELIKEIYENE